jgi:hypothetical protein
MGAVLRLSSVLLCPAGASAVDIIDYPIRNYDDFSKFDYKNSKPLYQ